MSAVPTTLFDNLYSYVVKNGTIIPQTSDIKASVESGMKTIFGADFSTDPTTPAGRLIEALAFLFIDVCGVNAQGGQLVNPNTAAGSQLDFLGAMFGISRETDPLETDESYRKKIIAGASRGSGYAESIRQALSGVSGLGNIVVIGNGDADPAMLPLDEYGNAVPHAIPVSAHSVFLSMTGVTSDNKNLMLKAVCATKSAGCGYDSENDSHGTVTTDQITEGNNTFTVKWHSPTEKSLSLDIDVDDGSYTGSDIETDTIDAVRNLLASNSTSATIAKAQIVAAIAAVGKGIVCTGVDITYGGQAAERIVVMPYEYIVASTATISVTIA